MTPKDTNGNERELQVSPRAKTFGELYHRLGGFKNAIDFAWWLDDHGYKTFPDMPGSPDVI